jgi:hypothetical protein
MMGKYKTLENRVNRLWAERTADDRHQIALRDGTTARLSGHQIIKGFQDAIAGLPTYESYVIRNGMCGLSSMGDRFLQMYFCIMNPTDTSYQKGNQL